jgi:hypothetical protein
MEPVNRLRPLSLLTGSLCLSHSRPGSSRAARAESVYSGACLQAHSVSLTRATPLLRSDTCAYRCLYTSTPLHLCLYASTPLLRSDTCAYSIPRCPSRCFASLGGARAASYDRTPQSHLYYWTDVTVLDRHCQSTLV